MASLNGTTNGNGTHRQGVQEKTKKKIILNAFVEMCSGHQSPGLWRHPSDESTNFTNLSHWTSLARLLEAGHFHGIFIADVLGGYDVYGSTITADGERKGNLAPAIKSGAQWPVHEPLSVVSAMAAVTESLGFGVTVSTSYEQPYSLARRLSTLDHLTNGRIGWNVVTGYLESAARNLGHEKQLDHDERYRICTEYMSVVYKLWQSSWRRDAVQLNLKTNTYTSPSLVREINHKGTYFTVPGPHICSPSPQRTPLIFQAGTSSSGRAFAAAHAEAVFVSGHSAAAVKKSIMQIRALAEEQGRKGSDVKFLAKCCPVLGKTQEEAEAKYAEYASYGDHEGALALFGGWTGVDMAQYKDDEELRYVSSNAIKSYIEALTNHAPSSGAGAGATKKWTKKTLAEYICVGGLGFTPVGTPASVADEMETWIREADVDGFNIAYAILPQTFTDVIDLLIPELRARGIFWEGYAVPGGTYRENLYAKPGQREVFGSHPAAGWAWDPPLPGEKGKEGEGGVGGDGEDGGEAGEGLDPVAMQLG